MIVHNGDFRILRLLEMMSNAGIVEPEIKDVDTGFESPWNRQKVKTGKYIFVDKETQAVFCELVDLLRNAPPAENPEPATQKDKPMELFSVCAKLNLDGEAEFGAQLDKLTAKAEKLAAALREVAELQPFNNKA